MKTAWKWFRRNVWFWVKWWLWARWRGPHAVNLEDVPAEPTWLVDNRDSLQRLRK